MAGPALTGKPQAGVSSQAGGAEARGRPPQKGPAPLPPWSCAQSGGCRAQDFGATPVWVQVFSTPTSEVLSDCCQEGGGKCGCEEPPKYL